ncbi:MAG: ATP-binding protein [Candidatus Methanoperedens sp.]|nr:ATP-binding protein [Candidatus Methanoperedens sp.]
MRKEEILEILSDWNFWAKEIDTGIKREDYIKKLIPLITETNQIVCIAGIRRSGKSTIVKQLAKELGGDVNTLLVNFEDERFIQRDLKLLREIFNTYLEKIKPEKKPFIFLDEIQNIPEWERFARGVHERKEATVVISGSSSKLLSAELATLLTGRNITFFAYPLSFKEFLKFKGISATTEIEALAKRIEIKRALDEYMEFGGFPEVVLSTDKKRILLGYFDTIITKDTINRFNIREREKIKTLSKFYLTNISSPVSFNKVSSFLGIPLTTVERFSDYIQTACLVFFIKRFSFSMKEQEKAQRKVYSIDTGLSNAVGFRFTKNTGKLMENIVATELKIRQSFDPGIEIYYWRDQSGREVDFVVKDGLKVRQLIQVCWDLSDMETKEREVKGLVKAMEEFNLGTGLMITEDFEGDEKIKNKDIIYKPLWKWLLLSW